MTDTTSSSDPRVDLTPTDQEYIAATFTRLKMAIFDYTSQLEKLREVNSRLTFQRKYLELLAEAIRLEGGAVALPVMHPTRSKR